MQIIDSKTGRMDGGLRSLINYAVLFLLVPSTIVWGILQMNDRQYYFISLLVIVYAMVPFALRIERRRPQAREIAVLAVMVAIGAAGRVAFFMAPQFKPCIAIIIITAVCLGGESGFLTGALTAFVSNLFMGQGPWTPWQMFCFGIIGFLAGVLAQSRLLPKKKVPLCIFGGLATILIYGGIMDPVSVLLMGQASLTKGAVIAAYISGLIPNIIHTSATVIFLLVLAEPMIEKLDRVKKKYGLLELDDRWR